MLFLPVVSRLSLLWYHTIVRPFLGMDGGDRGDCSSRRGGGGGVEAARLLLQEMLPLYPHSALFLFFTARVHRLKVRRGGVGGVLQA